MTGDTSYAAPSSVTAFGRATFPPGGRQRTRRVAAQAGFISAQEPPLCGGWPRNAPAGAVLALRANPPSRAPRKKAPPSRGKLSADRLTDEGNHGGAGRSFPPPPHPALRATFPPVGGRQRTRRLGAPYMVRTTRRGRWSLPLLSRFARHFPLTGGIGPIGPRAATWGRPYKKSGPFLPVGADLCVRPPLLGAQCAPTAVASPRPTGARQGCPAPSSGSSVSQSSRNSVIMAQ